MLCWASLFITLSSKAQVDSTTGNLINFTGTPTTTTGNWNNVGQFGGSLTCWRGGDPGYCGPQPRVNANGYGVINFSYGQTDLNQTVNINKALAAGGSGVQLSGFNFGFMAKNGNGWDNGAQDYLGAYVKFYNAAGGVAATYDYTNQTNRKYSWTNFNFSETFANPVAASNYSNAQVGFVGRDNNFWVGPYGPEIQNVSFSLKYRVDPCSSNPAYSPSCSGFSSIVTSGNLLNSNLMSNGDIVYNSFAVNTALKSSGAGVEVYGFNYGYNYSLGNARSTSECVSWTNAFTCGAYASTNPTAQVRVRLTDSSNDIIYSATQSRSTPNTAENASYQFLLPKTTNSLSLGTFTMGASTTGNAAIQNMYANALYKPDPCVDPLYSPSCPGYATAYAKNMILGSTVAAASAPAAPAAAAPALAQASPATAPDPTQPQQQAQQPAQSAPQQQGPAPAQDPNQNPTVAQDNPSQPSPQQAGPAPTQPQPAGGPPQTATASAPPPSAGPSQAGPQQGGGAGPSKLAMSVLKTAQANDKATQAAAVQQAAKAFEGSQASSQAASNLAITMNQDMSANSAVSAAAFASQTTQASQQTATQTIQQQQTTQTSTQTQQANKSGPQVQQQQQDTQQAQVQSSSIVQAQAPQQQEQQQTQTQSSTSVVKLLQPQQEQQQTQTQMTAGMMPMPQSTYTQPQQQQQDTQSTQVTMLKPPTQPTVEIQQQSSGTGLTLSRNPFAYNPLGSINTTNIAMVQPQPAPTFQFRNETKSSEIEAPQMPIASFSGVGKAGNPLSEMMMQQRFEMMQNNITPSMSSVNKNVQSNELAGGVDIASIAKVPAGFTAYSFILRDAAFYEPKEVYKNQKTVDNERVLRGLTRGSDSLHQQMVDQQYKIGN